MNRSQKRLGYLIAVFGTALLLVLRLALNEALAEQARLLPFVLAVMAAAWWGGLGPGLAATTLGVLLGVVFIVPPADSLWFETLADALNAGIFVVIGVTISLLCEALHASQRRETEKQFRTLADSMPQLVWMARPDGDRFWFNQRWYDYTGATLQQARGRGWQSFHDPAELDRVVKSWQAALASGQPWEDTYPLRRHDGQMRWHLCRAIPCRDEQGNIVCWFGTNTDVQDRIESERALKEADARKDQFLATLAHELRNPLAPIANALLLWPHVMNDRRELEYLREVIERQVKQLVRLIDDLMDVSRITRGKIKLRLEPVEVHSLIAAAIETVRPLMAANGQTLSVHEPDEPLYVQGDPARLTQVLCNILNNAAKYTGREGAIAVTASRRDGRAVVSILDNGPGIPAHMLDEIFESFHQVNETLDRSHGGLGIGLSLARQFVELHGGTLVARSEGIGRGSEFVISLTAVLAPRATAAVLPPSPSEQPGGVERLRVLVVDDFEESAETLAMVLRSLGHDAAALHDPQAAIGWIMDHRPDVVFLDVAMPKLDGYELARRVRKHPQLQDVLLIALTGYGQHEDRRRALEAGFDIHLTKPTNLKTLREVLFKLPVGRTSDTIAAC